MQLGLLTLQLGNQFLDPTNCDLIVDRKEDGPTPLKFLVDLDAFFTHCRAPHRRTLAPVTI